MPDRQQIMWGNVPVPYAASWTDEEEFFVSDCPYFHRPALCQKAARGQGKPRFGKPHMDRQRELIALGLCDLCCKPLKLSTKVSLSHAKPYPHGADGWAVLQVEPMLHRKCAAICADLCPALKRDVEQGSLNVRQVYKHRVQCALMKPEYTEHYVGGEGVIALGHAKVELIDWRQQDLDWLRKAA